MKRYHNRSQFRAALAALIAPIAIIGSTQRAHADHHQGDRDTSACVTEYDLSLNGKRIGQLTTRLENLHGNHWRYQAHTKARRGIVKASIRQLSEFTRTGSTIRPLTFSSRQKIAFARRNSDANYDWDAMLASGKHKKDSWTIDMPARFVDRLTLNEQLRLDLSSSSQAHFEYSRLDRGRLRPMTFERTDQAAAIEVPAGEFVTHLVEREHAAGDRRTASWHTPKLGFLPVRMEQLDDGKLTVTELTRVEGCDTILAR